MGGLANAGINDDGQVNFFNQNLDKIAGAQSLVAANGRGQRHNAGSACVAQLACYLQIGIHIGHHYKALLGKYFRSLNRLVIIGQQVLAILDDLDFYKISLAQLAGQAGNAHGFLGITCAGCIGQKRYVAGHIVQNIGQRSTVGAAQGQRQNFGSSLLHRRLNQLQRILARA